MNTTKYSKAFIHTPFIVNDTPRTELRVSLKYYVSLMCSDGACLAKIFNKHETAVVIVALIQSSGQKSDGAKKCAVARKILRRGTLLSLFYCKRCIIKKSMSQAAREIITGS
jgi:hypothetical protein